MKKPEDVPGISKEVEKLYYEEEKSLLSSEEWVGFSKFYSAFRRSAFKASLPFDPRKGLLSRQLMPRANRYFVPDQIWHIGLYGYFSGRTGGRKAWRWEEMHLSNKFRRY